MRRFAAFAAAALLASAACGGDSDKSAAKVAASATASPNAALSAALSSLAAAAEAAASAEASAAGAAAPGPGDCAEVAVSVKAALASAGDTVTDVKVIGPCTTLAVSTTLSNNAEGAVIAKALCTTAAAEASGKGIGSVRVNAEDGNALATGPKNAACTGRFG